MPFVKSKCPLPTRSLRLLRAAVWKCGFQPFSCPCSTYLPFVKSKSPLPTRNLRCLRAAAHSTSSALWLRHAHPSVAAAEKTCLMQRSRGFGHGVVVSRICWGIFRSPMVPCDHCDHYKTLNGFGDWAFIQGGWWGCQPFSCPCSQNVMYCRKEICSTCLFQESIPASPLGNAKHPLPTRSLRLLRAAVRSTSCALCLYYACKRSHSFVEDSGFVFWLSF